jgi:hypothetical protein
MEGDRLSRSHWRRVHFPLIDSVATCGSRWRRAGRLRCGATSRGHLSALPDARLSSRQEIRVAHCRSCRCQRRSRSHHPPLRETPPGLAVKTAFAETEHDRGNDSIQQNVASPNRVAEPSPGAVRSGEMRAIFRCKGVSDSSALCLVSHSHRVALDDKVETVEIIAACSQHAARILSKILRLALVGTGAEIQRTLEPDSEQRSDVRSSIGTDCGQPVELGVVKFPTPPLPGCRDRIWTAEWT